VSDGLPRIAYAANRRLGLECLDALLASGLRPVCLLLPAADRSSFAAEMRERVGRIPVVEGRLSADSDEIEQLRATAPHYLISIHYPYLFCAEVLAIPQLGALNLHPSWLPFNRGWHTPTWAILQKTPIGATLHWITVDLDAGDIALQRRVEISMGDTADSLYQKVLAAEVTLFCDAIPLIRSMSLARMKQPSTGTFHKARELEAVRAIDVRDVVRVGDLIDRLRALTTDRPSEWAWIDTPEGRFRIGLRIVPEKKTP
jgi:methionyl-tRNA formyltransferase